MSPHVRPKHACHYALLRFRPFVETGEFANVGVVLMAPEARFFAYRLLTKYGRITKFFHQLDRKVYFRGRELIKLELDRLAADLRRVAFGDAHTMVNARAAGALFTELTRPRETMVLFDAPRVALADEPRAKLDELFDHYVERNFVTREYQERLLEKAVHHVLATARLTATYRNEKVGNEEFSVTFPFVRMHDGRPERIIKPLYLAQEDTTKLLTHGGQWTDKIRRLRKRGALPDDVLMPVRAPAPDARAWAAFAEIREELQEQQVTVIAANDEPAILEFATR